MFGNNNGHDGNDDNQSNDNSISTKAQRFMYNALGIGDDPDESEEVEDEEPEEEKDPDTVPAVTLRSSQPRGVRKWSLGNHTMASDLNTDSIRETVDELEGVDNDLAKVLGEAASMVEGRSINGFECPVCGLNHGHSDKKHDVRDAFNVTNEFADAMPFDPYCHCGVNWLAEVVDFIAYNDVPMFTDEGQFEPFLSVTDSETMLEAVEELREMEREPDQEPSIEGALAQAGIRQTTEMVSSFDDFYTRYRNIQGASQSAPIADETRHEIDSMCEEIEEELEDEYELADEGELGTVTFRNDVGGYGFIASDEIEEEVFFHEEGVEIVNGDFDDLQEGVEVLVEAEHAAKGPRAVRVELTE